MDPETLNAMSEGIYSALLTLIQGVTFIVGLASALFVILCLVCLTLGVFSEMRQSTRHRPQPMPAPHELAEYDLSEMLAALDNGFDGDLRGKVTRPLPASIQQV